MIVCLCLTSHVNYKDLILSVKSAQRTHTFDCLFVFNVPPTAIKVICGRGYGFKSHQTDWRCRGSSLQGEFFIHYISHNVDNDDIQRRVSNQPQFDLQFNVERIEYKLILALQYDMS